MSKSPGKLWRKGNKLFYSSALLFLWIVVGIGFASDWIVIRGAFVESPMEIFFGLNGDLSQNILDDTATVLLIFFSDAILVR